MAALDFDTLVRRVIAIEQEAFATLNMSVDAVPYFFYKSEVYPFVTHRFGTITVTGDSETQDVYTVQLIARLVIGKVTTGYAGQPTDNLNTYLPLLIDTLNRRARLQSAAYPVAGDDLVEARVASAVGFGVFGSGDGTGEVGSDITLEFTLYNTLQQDYT